MNSTIDQKEIEKFSRIAEEWWDETGKFKPLHKFNPIRLSFIRKKISDHFGLEKSELRPFSGIRILDIGCGGGLVAEPISRLGADIIAIDASEKNIQIAKIHAEKSQLKIDYRAATAEELVEENEQFDVVLALEVIEHVANVGNFVKSCAALVKPNGLLFIATINRTAKSLLLAKFAIEYILRWLPAGTHDWRKFLKPSEISLYASHYNLELQALRGFSYNIFFDDWKECEDVNVNYMAIFKKLSS